MGKQYKTEEERKADIFKFFLLYLDQSASDRRQVVFGQLCNSILKWCKTLFFVPEEMELEIYRTVNRLVSPPTGKKSKTVPRDETGFFTYLKKALNNAKKQYYRDDNPSIIKTPRIIKDIKRIIAQEEAEKEQSLSEKEILDICRKFCKYEKKAKEYLRMITTKIIGSVQYYEGEEIDTFDSIGTPNPAEEPENTFFNDTIFRDAVELALKNAENRTRECYRSLFTAYCIKKSIDFAGFADILDNKIIEKFKTDGKKPNQYKVILIYYPKYDMPGAQSKASQMKKEFLKKLKLALETKKS